MFGVNDDWDPANFEEFPGCPRAHCAHDSYEQSVVVSILQICNFLGLLLLRSFIRTLGGLVMAGVLTGKLAI